jgi:hypothetical protein
MKISWATTRASLGTLQSLASFPVRPLTFHSKACEPFQDAIEYKNLSTTADDYSYCDVWPIDDAPDFKGCVDCLQAFEKRYLANCRSFTYLLMASVLTNTASLCNASGRL